MEHVVSSPVGIGLKFSRVCWGTNTPTAVHSGDRRDVGWGDPQERPLPP